MSEMSEIPINNETDNVEKMLEYAKNLILYNSVIATKERLARDPSGNSNLKDSYEAELKLLGLDSNVTLLGLIEGRYKLAYKLLGLSVNSSEEDIKYNFKKLRRQYHSDRAPLDQTKGKKYNEIFVALEPAAKLLLDSKKITNYSIFYGYSNRPPETVQNEETAIQEFKSKITESKVRISERGDIESVIGYYLNLLNELEPKLAFNFSPTSYSREDKKKIGRSNVLTFRSALLSLRYKLATFFDKKGKNQDVTHVSQSVDREKSKLPEFLAKKIDEILTAVEKHFENSGSAQRVSEPISKSRRPQVPKQDMDSTNQVPNEARESYKSDLDKKVYEFIEKKERNLQDCIDILKLIREERAGDKEYSYLGKSLNINLIPNYIESLQKIGHLFTQYDNDISPDNTSFVSDINELIDTLPDVFLLKSSINIIFSNLQLKKVSEQYARIISQTTTTETSASKPQPEPLENDLDELSNPEQRSEADEQLIYKQEMQEIIEKFIKGELNNKQLALALKENKNFVLSAGIDPKRKDIDISLFLQHLEAIRISSEDIQKVKTRILRNKSINNEPLVQQTQAPASAATNEQELTEKQKEEIKAEEKKIIDKWYKLDSGAGDLTSLTSQLMASEQNELFEDGGFYKLYIGSISLLEESNEFNYGDFKRKLRELKTYLQDQLKVNTLTSDTIINTLTAAGEVIKDIHTSDSINPSWLLREVGLLEKVFYKNNFRGSAYELLLAKGLITRLDREIGALIGYCTRLARDDSNNIEHTKHYEQELKFGQSADAFVIPKTKVDFMAENPNFKQSSVDVEYILSQLPTFIGVNKKITNFYNSIFTFASEN